ncbi:hypothetical protein ES703_78813 [subsurface metagenome]
MVLLSPRTRHHVPNIIQEKNIHLEHRFVLKQLPCKPAHCCTHWSLCHHDNTMRLTLNVRFYMQQTLFLFICQLPTSHVSNRDRDSKIRHLCYPREYPLFQLSSHGLSRHEHHVFLLIKTHIHRTVNQKSGLPNTNPT